MTVIVPFRNLAMSILAPSVQFRSFIPSPLYHKVGDTNSYDLIRHSSKLTPSQMYASSAIRARLATAAARRGFSTTRTQFGSPYHYAEGPRTNIPFNPLTKHFFWRYWAFMSL